MAATMKNLLPSSTWAALLAALASTTITATAANPNLLWYDKPAARWTEALPVGNGFLSLRGRTLLVCRGFLGLGGCTLLVRHGLLGLRGRTLLIGNAKLLVGVVGLVQRKPGCNDRNDQDHGKPKREIALSHA